MVQTMTCDRCGDPVPKNEAVVRTRRLTDVLAWHQGCYNLDHPHEIPQQRIPASFS